MRYLVLFIFLSVFFPMGCSGIRASAPADVDSASPTKSKEETQAIPAGASDTTPIPPAFPFSPPPWVIPSFGGVGVIATGVGYAVYNRDRIGFFRTGIGKALWEQAGSWPEKREIWAHGQSLSEFYSAYPDRMEDLNDLGNASIQEWIQLTGLYQEMQSVARQLHADFPLEHPFGTYDLFSTNIDSKAILDKACLLSISNDPKTIREMIVFRSINPSYMGWVYKPGARNQPEVVIQNGVIGDRIRQEDWMTLPCKEQLVLAQLVARIGEHQLFNFFDIWKQYLPDAEENNLTYAFSKKRLLELAQMPIEELIVLSNTYIAQARDNARFLHGLSPEARDGMLDLEWVLLNRRHPEIVPKQIDFEVRWKKYKQEAMGSGNGFAIPERWMKDKGWTPLHISFNFRHEEIRKEFEFLRSNAALVWTGHYPQEHSGVAAENDLGVLIGCLRTSEPQSSEQRACIARLVHLYLDREDVRNVFLAALQNPTRYKKTGAIKEGFFRWQDNKPVDLKNWLVVLYLCEGLESGLPKYEKKPKQPNPIVEDDPGYY